MVTTSPTASPFSLVTTFKAMAPPRTVIAHYALNGQMRSKEYTTLTAPLVSHHTRIYKRAMEKIIIKGQLRNKHFFIVIYHSSLVKSAIKAACVCKMRNGVSKMPSMSSFFNCQRRIFLKSLRDTSFNKDLSNEPNFSRIHLAGVPLRKFLKELTFFTCLSIRIVSEGSVIFFTQCGATLEM
jgi:hypothetical protein